MSLYSVKMRASSAGTHISGAERIVPFDLISATTQALTHRALHHPNGTPDFLNVSVQEITQDIVRVRALEVEEVPSQSVAETTDYLQRFFVANGLNPVALELLYTVTGLRGAMLIDARTGANLSPDPQRGVRVSAMDLVGSTASEEKQYFAEALALSSKVAAHPNILAELCISDDPNYTTGYLAFAGTYYRLRHCKEPGAQLGTRVFLYDGPESEVENTIDYLENTPVLVEQR